MAKKLIDPCCFSDIETLLYQATLEPREMKIIYIYIVDIKPAAVNCSANKEEQKLPDNGYSENTTAFGKSNNLVIQCSCKS